MRRDDVTFFLATGKTKKGAVDSLVKGETPFDREELEACPGVFMQGLLVEDGDGGVIYERRLNLGCVAAAVEEARKGGGLAIVGYDGERLMCGAADAGSEVVEELSGKDGEPRVEVCEGGEKIVCC